MATNNKPSILVNELLPEFLDSEGPKFQAFARAYYEWLETSNQIYDRSKNLLNYADIDNTTDEFVKYFQREVMADFPENILADKALLISRIKDLYRSKGSEQAYKLLFRILYNDEINFYYPGQDILRVSDGRWVQETSLRLSAPFVGNLYDIGGKNIAGATSGARAKVDRVTATIEQGVDVFEVFLIKVVGTFQDTEIVASEDGLLSGVILSSIGPLQQVEVTFGGGSHRVGDSVSFTSDSGSAANGVITTVDGSSILPLILDGGSGFSNNAIISITGGSGLGAEFEVDGISNTETLFFYQDTISDLSSTRIDANTYITSNTGSISANLAIANSSTILGSALGTSNVVVGTISSVSAVTRGGGYNILPSVTVREDAIADQNLSDGAGGIKGFNASLAAVPVGGSITSVAVDSAGTGYNRIDAVTITNTTRSAQNGTGSAGVSGIVNYDGKYTDTKGFLSWNNRLQDNYYYQQFAYVLRTDQSLDAYREIVKSILHPGGVNLFADLRIESNVALSFSANTYIFYSVEFAVAEEITSTLEFGPTAVSYLLSPTTIAPTTDLSTDSNVSFSFELGSIEPTVIFSTDYDIDMTIGGATLISVDSALTFGTTLFELFLDPNTITSTAAVSTDASVEFNLDPVPIGTTVIFSTDYNIDTTIGGADLISIDPSLSFGTSVFGLNVDPATIVSTEVVPTDGDVLFTTNMFVEPIVSTLAISTDYIIDMNIGGADLISVDSSLIFGSSTLDMSMNVDTLSSTVIVPQPEVLLNVGGADLISIDSTLAMSTDHRVDQRGDGLVSNFIVNDVNDLSAQQVSDYSSFPIETFPGNRVIDGIGTSFTSQLSPGTVFTIDDVAGSGEEFTLTVDIINDANTLSVTANVLYSNGDLAVISDSAYYYTV